MSKPIYLRLNLIILLATLSLNVTATVYKWIDADGITHYTHALPPGVVPAESLTLPPSVDSENALKLLKQKQEKVDAYRQSRQEKQQLQQQQETAAAFDRKNCEIAKRNLASLQPPRITLTNAAGETYRVPEEERLARLKKAQEDVSKYCQ